jgi:hypothetical protein
MGLVAQPLIACKSGSDDYFMPSLPTRTFNVFPEFHGVALLAGSIAAVEGIGAGIAWLLHKACTYV